MTDPQIDALSPAELDAAIGRALGLNVVGTARLGESGGLVFAGDQFPVRSAYVHRCLCACDPHPWCEPVGGMPKTFGHHLDCLSLVPEYSTDWNAMRLLLDHVYGQPYGKVRIDGAFFHGITVGLDWGDCLTAPLAATPPVVNLADVPAAVCRQYLKRLALDRRGA